jgi:EAL domain-containing protein (putative c-di-GMP-specific phosphodiesterase class I)
LTPSKISICKLFALDTGIASQVEVLIDVLDRLPTNIWLSYNLSQSALETGEAWPVIPVSRANNLHIEILEGVNLQTEKAVSRIKFIHECGHEIFADDVGQGYSLPTMMANIPLNGIKLDKILIDGIPNNKNLCLLVSGILDWANSKGLTTIAEWLQTPEQAQWLRWHGCQLGQGSLYGLAQELPFN